MSEIELYGLMAIAQEHQKTAQEQQKTVEKAGKQLETAAAVLSQTVAQHRGNVEVLQQSLQQAAKSAIAEAVKNQAFVMSGPLEESAKKTAEAAQTAAGKLALLNSWVIFAVFAAGVLAGVGGAVWYHRDQAKYVVPVSEVMDYVEKHPPKR